MKGVTHIAVLYSLLLAPSALAGAKSASGDAVPAVKHHVSRSRVRVQGGVPGRELGGAGGSVHGTVGEMVKRVGVPQGFDSDAGGTGGAPAVVSPAGSAEPGSLTGSLDGGSGSMAGSSGSSDLSSGSGSGKSGAMAPNPDSTIEALNPPVLDNATLVASSAGETATLASLDTSTVKASPIVSVNATGAEASANGAVLDEPTGSVAHTTAVLTTLTSARLTVTATETSKAVTVPTAASGTGAANSGGVQEPILPDPPASEQLPVPEPPAGLGGSGGGTGAGNSPHSAGSGSTGTEPAVPNPQKAVPSTKPASPSGETSSPTPSSGSSPSGTSSSTSCSAASSPSEAVTCLLDASPQCTVIGGGCGVLVELQPYIKTDIDACKDFVTLSAQVCAQCGGTQELYDLYNAYLTQCGAAAGSGSGGGASGVTNSAPTSGGTGSGTESSDGDMSGSRGEGKATTGGLQTTDEALKGPYTPSSSSVTDSMTPNNSATSAAPLDTIVATTAKAASSSATDLPSTNSKNGQGATGDEDDTPQQGVRTGQTKAEAPASPVQPSSSSDGPGSSSTVGTSGHSGTTGDTAGGNGGTGSGVGQSGVTEETAPMGAGRTPSAKEMESSVQANERINPKANSTVNGVMANESTELGGPNRSSTADNGVSGTKMPKATATGASDADDVGHKTDDKNKTAKKEPLSAAAVATRDYFKFELNEACEKQCQNWVDDYKVS